MSDRDIGNLYKNIRAGNAYNEPVSEKDLYRLVYEGKKDNKSNAILTQMAGSEATDGVGDIVVLYGDVEKINANLEQLKQMGLDSMILSREYFEAGIKGRLDEKMVNKNKRLVQLAMKAEIDKEDPVTRKAVYEVLATYQISADQLEGLIRLKASKDDKSDALLMAVLGDGVEQYWRIDVENCLLQNVQTAFQVSDEKAVSLIRDLWNVKAVTGVTSVGRGEMAMSLLSRGYKGEPGDVKFKTQGVDIDCEVKGYSGRPGKGDHAKNFAKNKVINELIAGAFESSGSELATDSEGVIGQSIQSGQAGIDKYGLNWKTLYDYFVASAEALHPGVDIRSLFDPIVNDTSSTNINTIFQDMIKEWKKIPEYRNVDKTWGDGDKYAGAKSGLAPKVFGSFMNKEQPDVEVGAIKHVQFAFYGKIGGEKPGPKSLAGRICQRNSVIANPTSIIQGLPFSDAVKTFFTGIAPMLSHDDQARGLLQTRSEEDKHGVTDEVLEPVRRLLSEILRDGRDISDPTFYTKVIGAMQVTSYCIHDKFNRVMLINDNKEGGSMNAFVIITDHANPAMTFANVFNTLDIDDFNVKTSIDDRNHGVNLEFNG